MADETPDPRSLSDDHYRAMEELYDTLWEATDTALEAGLTLAGLRLVVTSFAGSVLAADAGCRRFDPEAFAAFLDSMCLQIRGSAHLWYESGSMPWADAP